MSIGPTSGAIHWQDGVYFERMPNGDVKVWKDSMFGRVFEITVPHGQWISIAAMLGIHPQSYDLARMAHMGR